MKHADFHIGLEFVGSAGFRWRCTDVGARTVVAIALDRNDPHWYQGPPYIAKEVVFDEHKIEHCYFTDIDAIAAAVLESETTGHPGYPDDVVRRMLKAARAHSYPHSGVLRFDRRRQDGEILHPYAGRKVGQGWVVELYLPFAHDYAAMAERDFIALPRALAVDMEARAGKKS